MIEYNLNLEEAFFSLIISYFKKLQNKSLMYVFFQFRSVPDNIQVSRFLIECAIKNRKIVDFTCFHYSLDIFTRLKKTDEILKIFIEFDMVILLFMKDDEATRLIEKCKNLKNFLQSEYYEKLKTLVNVKTILPELNR